MINLAILKPLWGFAKKHATKLLAGLAIGSEAAALYLTAKEAPVVKEKLAELPPDATNMEKFKVGAKGYAPAGAAAAVSMVSIALSVIVGEQQKMALAVAGSAYQAAAAKYQEALMKKGGKSEVEKVEKELAEEKVTHQRPDETLPVLATGKGDELIFDPLSGRLFTSSWNEVENAAIRINKQIFGSIWVSVNEWYAELGIEDVGLAVDRGWNVDHMLEIGSQAIKTKDGRACLSICYYNRPIRYK